MTSDGPGHHRRRITQRFLALPFGVALALIAPLVASASPAIERGWPVIAPAGEVLPGPGGGPVVISDNQANFDITALAFRKTGARRWIASRKLGCGNCEPPTTPRLNADGTFGPIGSLSDDFWAVSQTGAIVAGCAGVTLNDGTCIASPGDASVEARRGRARLWKYAEPNFSWSSGFEIPPLMARDSAGVIYVQWGSKGAGVFSDGAGGPARARLVALNPDGSFRSRALGELEPLAGLSDGVVVRTAKGIAAINQDATRRWTRSLARPRQAVVKADPARERVYLRDGLRRVRALDARTGKQLWQRSAAMIASIGASGRIYLVTGGNLVAVSPAGKVLWRNRSPLSVADAAELPDGRIAISTNGIYGWGAFLTRVNPKREAPPVRRSRIRVSRTVINPRCSTDSDFDLPLAQECDINRSRGTVMRIDLRRASKVKIRFRELDGSPTPRLKRKAIDLRAPAGVSHVRLLVSENRLKAGRRRILVVYWEGGKGRVVRIPIRTT